MKRFVLSALMAVGLFAPVHANATIVSLGSCTGAAACVITNTPPDPVVQNPNDNILLAWNEVQNIVLTEDLRVDRVFDPSADFVVDLGNGDYLIKAGTVVSSHYFQFDGPNVQTTLQLDSQVFAFITSDQNLFNSDDLLGLPGIDYADFGLRGLENGDTTTFNGPNVDINWSTGSPGDWTRLITAYSPTAAVPVPAAAPLMLAGLGALGWMRRRPKTA